MIMLPKPNLQVGFAIKLDAYKNKCLQTALEKTVSALSIQQLDTELNEFVGNTHLAKLAAKGLRGELLFAVPCILKNNPELLGYYRLLLGYSQKSFYNASTGMGIFKRGEERGSFSIAALQSLDNACRALCEAAQFLLDGIGCELLSKSLLHELSLLTLGPQMRGGVSNVIGQAGIASVFNIILDVVKKSVVVHDDANGMIVLQNAANRRVTIEFAADPDIIIYERVSEKTTKKIIAIEIKAGEDISNIHNRLGEAEKSHQKARLDGFTECWTIFNVDLDYATAKKESPSTDRFYNLAKLLDKNSDEFDDFKDQIVYLTGIPN